jgi:hypothetical protein
VPCLVCCYQDERATQLSLYDLLRLYEHLTDLKGLKVFPLSLIVLLLRPTGFFLMPGHLAISHDQGSPMCLKADKERMVAFVLFCLLLTC